MKVALEYGLETLSLEVADGDLAGVMEPGAAEPLEDAGQAIEASLAAPLEEALEGKESVLILTAGHGFTSPQELLEPVLRGCRAAGAQATICVANGARRALNESELKDHLGPAVLLGPVQQHDAWSDELHVDCGATARGTPVRLNRTVRAFDALLGVGFVGPSQAYGFSGGKELVVPGLAHQQTIAANQRWLFHPDAEIGVMYGNPASDDAQEAASAAPLMWATCAVVDGAGRMVRVASGRARRAHLAACRAARGIYEVPARRAKIVVASAGGRPHDFDLALAAEALGAAGELVEAGGAIVLAAECADGWGPGPALEEWLRERSPQEILTEAPSSAAGALGVHGAYLAARPAVEKGAAIILVTCAGMVQALEGSFVQACTDLGEGMERARAHAGEASVAVLRQGRQMILS